MRKFDRYWFRKGEDVTDACPKLMLTAIRVQLMGMEAGARSLMRIAMFPECYEQPRQFFFDMYLPRMSWPWTDPSEVVR